MRRVRDRRGLWSLEVFPTVGSVLAALEMGWLRWKISKIFAQFFLGFFLVFGARISPFFNIRACFLSHPRLHFGANVGKCWNFSMLSTHFQCCQLTFNGAGKLSTTTLLKSRVFRLVGSSGEVVKGYSVVFCNVCCVYQLDAV